MSCTGGLNRPALGRAGPAASDPALLHADTIAPAPRHGGGWLLAAGAAAFGAALGVYIAYALTHPLPKRIDPVDLRVYPDGGRIVRHLRFYHPHRPSPLYDRPGFEGPPSTYPPSPRCGSRS